MKRIVPFGAAAAVLLSMSMVSFAQDPPQQPQPKTFTLVLQGAI